jgi:hypothetical protein
VKATGEWKWLRSCPTASFGISVDELPRRIGFSRVSWSPYNLIVMLDAICSALNVRNPTMVSFRKRS